MILETVLGFFTTKPRLLGLVGVAGVLVIALAGMGVRCALLSADLKAEQAAHAATAERGLRELADLRAEVADKDTVRALAVADAERTARLKLEAEIARVNALATELACTRKRLGDARREFSRRIAAHAAQDATVAGPVFGPDYVRLYNKALGLDSAAGARGGPVLTDPATAGSGDTAHAAGAADPRLLPAASGVAVAVGRTRSASPADSDIRDGVSGADILAHIRDYGGRCQALEAQVIGLIRFAEGQ